MYELNFVYGPQVGAQKLARGADYFAWAPDSSLRIGHLALLGHC